MPKNLILRDAADARNSIVERQEKEIANLYKNWAKEVGERAEYYRNKTTPSSVWQEANLRQLQRSLEEQSKVISNNVANGIKQNMYLVSDSVIQSNVKWMEQFGFDHGGLSAMFTSVPDDVIHRLVTGQVYESGWSLSKAIWTDNEKTLQDIYTIVAAGRVQNLPIYDVAKQLQAYVNPEKANSWNPVIRMRNTKTGEWEYKRIYKSAVDYNAQRLARTLAQHTYQQTLVSAAKVNPFIQKFIWWANGSRACEECEERDGQEFKVGDLPMDHPNGMCVMEPVVDEEKMIDDLVDWINAEDGAYPEIDKFAESVGYTPTSVVAGKSNLANAAIQNPGTYNKWDIDKLDEVSRTISVNQEGDEDGSYVYGLYVNTNESNVINYRLREAAEKGMDPVELMRQSEQNGILTKGSADRFAKTIEAMDRGFASYELQENIQVQRFVKGDFLEETFGSKKVTDIKNYVGSVVENNQYLSTTVVGHDSFGNRSVMLSIQANAGTRCLPTTNLAEGEIVFGRNYDLEIVGVQKYSGKNPLEMTTPSGDTAQFKGLEIVCRLVEK